MSILNRFNEGCHPHPIVVRLSEFLRPSQQYVPGIWPELGWKVAIIEWQPLVTHYSTIGFHTSVLREKKSTFTFLLPPLIPFRFLSSIPSSFH